VVVAVVAFAHQATLPVAEVVMAQFSFGVGKNDS
jgi:hypothetical protein